MDASAARSGAVKEAVEVAGATEDAPEPPGGQSALQAVESSRATQTASTLVGRDVFRATDEEWTSWRWQMSNSLRTTKDFETVLNLSDEERQGLALASRQFIVAATPYFVSLMDRNDPNCPIRRQVVPSIRELHVSATDMEDPCGEEHDMKTPGLVHRYPDRVLFLASDRCAGYCRYCTRSRLVGAGELKPVTERVELAAAYVAAHPEVRDVLISGGDPLLSGEALLSNIIRKFKAIPHVEIVRLGSRVPSYLPQRVTSRLVNTLRAAGAFYLSLHFSHPREITPEVERALATIADAGIVMGSQTVLLRGINDDAATLKRLFQLLVKNRVRPYYLYQCDPVKGASHFRTSVATGIEIMRQVRGYTSGYAVPTYVIDAPGGGGKTPVMYDYVTGRDEKEVTLRNYAGETYKYPEI